MDSQQSPGNLMKPLVRLTLACSLALAGSALHAHMPDPALTAPSSTAQRLYAEARKDLLQIRVLVSNGRAQSSVGSGFLLGDTNLVVTNYHVIAEIAPGAGDLQRRIPGYQRPSRQPGAGRPGCTARPGNSAGRPAR